MRVPIALCASLTLLAGCSVKSGDGPGTRAAVEQIVHDYILAHPEIVPQAMERLRANEATKAIVANRAAIEQPFAAAWAGSATPKVTLVMFTDYSCGYCKASTADITRLIAANPDLRVVWREIPVLGPQSEVAAKVALAAAGEGKYLAFHQGLFAAGHPDMATLAQVARTAGMDPGRLAERARAPAIEREIAGNLRLASLLSVSGTPAFVVGDRMLSGAVGYEALRQAVDAARKG